MSPAREMRSEEHTSELQSPCNLVCRLLLEQKTTDGAEALAIASAQQPDLILLDIMMPKIDGIEVCKRLKADTSLPFMPIIMLTAKADTKDVVAVLEAGADEYLTKPVDQASLVVRVKSMLRIKALHDTAQEQAAFFEEKATPLAASLFPLAPLFG